MTNNIPLNLFQSYNTLDLPFLIKENINELQKNNSELKYHLFDIEMCRKFIEDNFDDNVLYSFNKLKSNVCKMDLWKYCVLYIHGGIYLDIKFKCITKLIQLTDKEYFVKNENNICDELIVCFPKNKILYKCIMKIIENVENNFYGLNSSHITGSHLISYFFISNEINNLSLCLYDNKTIKNKNDVVCHYFDNPTSDHNILWNTGMIYNYVILKSKQTKDLSRCFENNFTCEKIEMKSNIPTIVDGTTAIYFSSSTPTIFNKKSNLNEYYINSRWINYSYIDGIYNNKYDEIISFNSLCCVDNKFNIISNDKFLKDEDCLNTLENIKFIEYKDNIYYIGTCMNKDTGLFVISSDICDLDNAEYKKNIITHYDEIKKHEKNWVFAIVNNQLRIIYNWFPLQIGEIDWNTNMLNIVEIKYNTPEYFKNANGSTNGHEYNNEIWFVLHLISKNNNYVHFFAVFDLNMNLIRYSEQFKFYNCAIEWCNGLIIKDNNIILSYSLFDTASIIATYDIDYINKLKWFFINAT